MHNFRSEVIPDLDFESKMLSTMLYVYNCTRFLLNIHYKEVIWTGGIPFRGWTRPKSGYLITSPSSSPVPPNGLSSKT